MRRRDESGAASIVVIAMVMVLVAVSYGAATVVAAVIAHRSAQNAADLVALAAAEAVPTGHACARADSVAQANGVQLTGCSVDGSVVVVEVAVTTRFGIHDAMRARARAGPASLTAQ